MKQIFNRLTSLVFMAFLLFMACDSKKQEPKEPANVEKAIREVEITQSEIEALEYEDYALSDTAQKAVAEWSGFQEVAAPVDYLKTGDFTFFKNDITEIKKVMEQCRFKVTKEFFTDQIMARLTVVETRFLKLQNDLTLDNISKEEQLNSIKEVLTAWSNLIYVMNKKFEFEETDVERPQKTEDKINEDNL